MTVDNKPAPRCPYCGGEMKIETFENYTGWCGQAVCKACKSQGAPKRYYNLQEEAQQAAYTAAMQRWQEPNRVMTLEEIIDKVSDAVGGVPVWIEHINDTEQNLAWKLSGWKVVRGAERCVLIFDTGHSVDTKNINTTWRCWLRKPTQEERAAAPWGGKDNAC